MTTPVDMLLGSVGIPLHLARGSHAFRAGDEAMAWLIVRAGIVRAHLPAESGRETVLSRVGAHEGCVLTTSSLLASTPYAAEAVCETDVEALAVPKAAFRRLMAENEAFRDFVLTTYAERIADLILVMEETAFQGVPRRLARMLLARAENGMVSATHQALAQEIGTAREVVSRQIKEFERRGLVHAQRGLIEISDRAGLLRISANTDEADSTGPV